MKFDSDKIFLANRKFVVLVLIAAIFFFIFFSKKIKINQASYSIFIEFDNIHGIKPGTILRLRGLNIGTVIGLKLDQNAILVLAKIKSSLYIIPRNILIEINQTGLLNEATIDMFPLELLDKDQDKSVLNPLSPTCSSTKIICNLSYLEGSRGLNYDDLVRATTRISQRFDDPRFFNLIYLFLQNSMDLSDKLLKIAIGLFDSLLGLYQE